MATGTPLENSPRGSVAIPYAASMATTEEVARIGSCLLSCASFYVPVPYPASKVAAAAVDESYFNDESWSQSLAFSDSGFRGEGTLPESPDSNRGSLYAALCSSAAVPASLGQSPPEVAQPLNAAPPEPVPGASRGTNTPTLKPRYPLTAGGMQHCQFPEAVEPRRKHRRTNFVSASSSSSRRRLPENAFSAEARPLPPETLCHPLLPASTTSPSSLVSPPSPSSAASGHTQNDSAAMPAQRFTGTQSAADSTVCFDSGGGFNEVPLPLYSSMYDYTAAAVFTPPDVPVLSSLEDYVDQFHTTTGSATSDAHLLVATTTVAGQSETDTSTVVECLPQPRRRSSRRSNSSSSSSSSCCSILKIPERRRSRRGCRRHDFGDQTSDAGDSDSAPWPPASSPEFLLWVSERIAKMRRRGSNGRRRLGAAERVERAFRSGNMLSDSEDSQGSFNSGADDDAESFRSDAAVVSAPMDPRRTVAALHARLGEWATTANGNRSGNSATEAELSAQTALDCQQLRQRQRERREASNLVILRKAAEYIQRQRSSDRGEKNAEKGIYGGAGGAKKHTNTCSSNINTSSRTKQNSCHSNGKSKPNGNVAASTATSSSRLSKHRGTSGSSGTSNRQLEGGDRNASLPSVSCVLTGEVSSDTTTCSTQLLCSEEEVSHKPERQYVTSMGISELIELVVFPDATSRRLMGTSRNSRATTQGLPEHNSLQSCTTNTGSRKRSRMSATVFSEQNEARGPGYCGQVPLEGTTAAVEEPTKKLPSYIDSKSRSNHQTSFHLCCSRETMLPLMRKSKVPRIVPLSEVRRPELLPRGFDEIDSPEDKAIREEANFPERSRSTLTHDQAIVIRRHQKHVTRSLMDLQIQRDRGEVTLRQFEFSKAQVFNCLFRRRTDGSGVEVCSMWRLPKMLSEVCNWRGSGAARRKQLPLHRLRPRNPPGTRPLPSEHVEPAAAMEERGAANVITAPAVVQPPYSPSEVNEDSDDSDLDEMISGAGTDTPIISPAEEIRLARRIAASIARDKGAGATSAKEHHLAEVSAAVRAGSPRVDELLLFPRCPVSQSTDPECTSDPGAFSSEHPPAVTESSAIAIAKDGSCSRYCSNDKKTRRSVRRGRPLFEPPSDTDFFIFSQPEACLQNDDGLQERRQLNIERRQKLMRALDQRAPPEFRMFPQDTCCTPTAEQLQFWEAWRAGSQDLQYTAGYLGQLENRTIIFPADIKKLME